jgi:proline dehydrogenase
MLRALLLAASENATLRRIATGWAPLRRLALHFVAGETLAEGLEAARRLAGRGRSVTLDYLGESVTEASQARAAAKVIVETLARIGEEDLPAGISVKPSQLGLGLDDDAGDAGAGLCRELLGEIAAAAQRVGAHVTLDMEGSDATEATVALVEDLRAAGHGQVGCAVQSYLRRTPADVQRLTAAGASLRLTKGAYAEPPEVAFQDKLVVDRAYDQLAVWLLANGVYPRLATHDHRLVARARAHAATLGLTPDAFEFQLLYGVREPLQEALVRDGYRVRVYVPFGEQWYPYFVRRLAERPANVLFFLRALAAPVLGRGR